MLWYMAADFGDEGEKFRKQVKQSLAKRSCSIPSDPRFSMDRIRRRRLLCRINID
jgi:hypothetical protein